MTPHRTAVIVTGGSPLPPHTTADLPTDAFVIAADSGLDHALAAGLHVDLVVGDLDSVSAAALQWAQNTGVRILRHPCDKDSTDTELALGAALAHGAPDIVLLGGGGDRLDHTLGAITALGHSSLARCASVVARWGDAILHVIHGPRSSEVPLAVGATFSVLSLHGTCEGVTVHGARWPLANALLPPGSSIGVSNEATAPLVVVHVDSGVLTLIVPTNMDVAS